MSPYVVLFLLKLTFSMPFLLVFFIVLGILDALKHDLLIERFDFVKID
jgi:hypothetical protein